MTSHWERIGMLRKAIINLKLENITKKNSKKGTLNTARKKSQTIGEKIDLQICCMSHEKWRQAIWTLKILDYIFKIFIYEGGT